MPVIAKDEAVARLTKAVERAPADDLVEIYNELFPDEPVLRKSGYSVLHQHAIGWAGIRGLHDAGAW